MLFVFFLISVDFRFKRADLEFEHPGAVLTVIKDQQENLMFRTTFTHQCINGVPF